MITCVFVYNLSSIHPRMRSVPHTSIPRAPAKWSLAVEPTPYPLLIHDPNRDERRTRNCPRPLLHSPRLCRLHRNRNAPPAAMGRYIGVCGGGSTKPKPSPPPRVRRRAGSLALGTMGTERRVAQTLRRSPCRPKKMGGRTEKDGSGNDGGPAYLRLPGNCCR